MNIYWMSMRRKPNFYEIGEKEKGIPPVLSERYPFVYVQNLSVGNNYFV